MQALIEILLLLAPVFIVKLHLLFSLFLAARMALGKAQAIVGHGKLWFRGDGCFEIRNAGRPLAAVLLENA